jgi:transposase-like protein
MDPTKPLTGQCPHCGATAEKLAYHSRYTLKSGHLVTVIRCKQHNGTFCGRYGTACYDLKTEEEKVERAVHQNLEGLHPQAIARIEGVHPTTVQRWIDRAARQGRAADQEVVSDVQAEAVEFIQLDSFAGLKRPDAGDDPEAVGQHWTHLAMVRESRLMLEVVGGGAR